MPYIKWKDRQVLDETVSKVEFQIQHHSEFSAGWLNYLITKTIHAYIRHKGKNYQNLNEVMGVLSCVQSEFYRKVVSPYEEIKIRENGDLENTP